METDPPSSAEDRLAALSKAYQEYVEASAKDSSSPQHNNLIEAYRSYQEVSDSFHDSNTEDPIRSAVTFCQRKFDSSSSPQVGVSSLRHKVLCPKDSGGATSTAIRVGGLSIIDDVKENTLEYGGNKREGEGDEDTSVAKVTLIEKDGHTYTRIGHGPTCKRSRPNPGLRHIQLPHRQDSSSSRLRRSSSVPSNAFNPGEDPESENKNPFAHRLLFRTGSSVSDSTKAKLRDDILSGKSAAVWRKPSITELEISIVHHSDPGSDDDSSSGSEDEEDMIDDSLESLRYPISSGKRKHSGETSPPVETIATHFVFDHPPPSSLSPIPTVMTTAGS